MQNQFKNTCIDSENRPCVSGKFSTLMGVLGISLMTTVFVGCAALNDPYGTGGGYGTGGYQDPYSRGPAYDPYYDYEARRAQREQDRLREERYRLEQERERLERERERPAPPPPPPPVYRPPVQDSCPPGFSPGGRCSPEERKRGCRDLRTPGGTPCVSR